jgi:hypothetical protein
VTGTTRPAAYALCADRRDAEGQKALFTDDTRFAVYMDGEGSEPTYVLQGREALEAADRPALRELFDAAGLSSVWTVISPVTVSRRTRTRTGS